jgi:hypothetical protein
MVGVSLVGFSGSLIKESIVSLFGLSAPADDSASLEEPEATKVLVGKFTSSILTRASS